MRLIAITLLAIAAWPAQAQEAAYAAFGRHAVPSAGTPAAFGTYTRGCLSGGAKLAETAPLWQAMKPARNRYWGHPDMISFIQRLAGKARDAGWPGLYIGDIGQPRGGPMKSGHRSHQMGLDVDIWLRKPTSWRPMSRRERDGMWSHVVVAKNGVDLNGHWTPSHHRVLKAAASDPAVARIFVNAAIKRWMCNHERGADGRVDAPWLRKIRPWKGHNAHFHVRMKCPVGSRHCRDQGAPPAGPGCGAELSKWFPGGRTAKAPRDATKKAPSEEASGETKFKWAGRKAKTRAFTVDKMPSQCHVVLSDNAAALAQINARSETAAVAATINIPVFFDDTATAHEGYIGTRYFWRPKVDLNAARARDVSLRIKGELPPGLKFLDRGGGNGLLRGKPTEAGIFRFAIIARQRGAENARQDVRLTVINLDGEDTPIFADNDSAAGTDDTGTTDPRIGAAPGEDSDLPSLPSTGKLGVTIGKAPDKDVNTGADGGIKKPAQAGADTNGTDTPTADKTGPGTTTPETGTPAGTPDKTPGKIPATGTVPRFDPFKKDPLVASLEHQVKDFLTEFTGDECFLAVPYKIAKAEVKIETFADDKDPILAFDRTFLQAIGIEARVGGRLIAQPQCPSLAFVRAHPYGNPAPVETAPANRVVKPGEPITLAVAAARVRTLSMMVVWPDGQIFDLTDYLERRGNRYAVTVKASGSGPQVIVAIDSAQAIPAAARAAAVKAGDLFSLFQDERDARKLDIRASVSLIVVE